ncbi:MAG: response regulator, partial [Deltaproteobacteria bacterium]|jgi:CheY-like chemotaxis protein|nr:response regulator [Deltaproteobacteria bacterium]
VAVNLNDSIESAIKSPPVEKAANMSRRAVKIVRNSPERRPVVKGSPAHIKKIVSNLILNAIEGLAGIGRSTLEEKEAQKPGLIEINVGSEKLERALAGFENFTPGDYVYLEVKDNGPPVPLEDRDHAFEPFYGKKPGSGRGLELAIVELVAKEHGGGVGLASDVERTAFRVYLPRAQEVRTGAGGGNDISEYNGCGQKVLVVDDVDIQRKLASKMLKSLGYEPVSVASGEEAVEFIKTHDVDLVILDMIMDPGINGRETYEAILSIKPGQKAIIASGMAENEEVEKAQALGASHFVSKPYSLQDIAGAVHKALFPERE